MVLSSAGTWLYAANTVDGSTISSMRATENIAGTRILRAKVAASKYESVRNTFSACSRCTDR
jgi:hypothetical protein